MRKKTKSHGINFYSWIAFGGIVIITVLTLWISQMFLLKSFYSLMKMREVRKIGDELSAKFCSGDFESTLYKRSFENGFWVTFYTEDGEELRPQTDEQIGQIPPYDEKRRFINNRRNPEYDFENIKNKINESENQSTVYEEENEMFHSQAMVYAAKLKNESGDVYYMILKAPLADVSATKTVLWRQLVYVTFLSFAAGIILAAVFARKISKPIMGLTESAKVLAHGSYNVKFQTSSFKEINKLSEVLNYAAEELSKNDELRRDLIANVSHDLRTPLTIIKSYAEMIRDLSGDNPKKREEHTNVIIGEADRLSKLVNDMLDLSKYEAGAVKLEVSGFDLGVLVRQTVEKFCGMYENEGYVFETKIDKNVLITADEAKINQVVFNLISNAVNYTGEDKKVIINVSKSGKKVKFSVTDTGCGIEKDEIKRVWDRYYRASKNLDRKGSGIGLAIVKNILLAHNADFGIDSEINVGSTFWFEI